jgi:hypothetical protein
MIRNNLVESTSADDVADAREKLASLPPLPADASELAKCERAVLRTQLLHKIGVRLPDPDGHD